MADLADRLRATGLEACVQLAEHLSEIRGSMLQHLIDKEEQ